MPQTRQRTRCITAACSFRISFRGRKCDIGPLHASCVNSKGPVPQRCAEPAFRGALFLHEIMWFLRGADNSSPQLTNPEFEPGKSVLTNLGYVPAALLRPSRRFAARSAGIRGLAAVPLSSPRCLLDPVGPLCLFNRVQYLNYIQ